MEHEEFNKLALLVRRIEAWLSFIACLMVILSLPNIIDFATNRYKGLSFGIAMWAILALTVLIFVVLISLFRRGRKNSI